MIIETDDYGLIDIGDLEGDELAEAYAEEKGRRADLEAIVDRLVRTIASRGFTTSDSGDMAIADRDMAIARFNEMLADFDEVRAA